MAELPKPPPGFTLDGAVPPPPPGFTLDNQPRQQSLSDYASGLTNAVTQGITFNLADEASAAGAAANQFVKGVITGKGISGATEMGGKAYSDVKESERRKREGFRGQNPVSAFLAEVLGGFGAAKLPMASATALAPAATTTAAQTVPQLAKQGAAVGATGGAIAGFGSGEGAVDSAQQAALGGTVGGVIGGAVPLIATGVARYGGRIADNVGLRNPAEAANRQVLRAFERDATGGGPSLVDVQARVAGNTGAAARPELIPDVAGENVMNLARASTQMPGAARQQAQAAIAARQATQPDRIADDVARLVSPNADYHGTVQGLQQARSTAAQPLYDRAFARNAWSPRVDDFLNDPIGKQGLAKGLEILRLESVAQGKPVDWKQLGVVFNEAGDPQLVAKPNMRLLDAVKRGMDDLLEPYRNGVTGRLVLDQRGRAIDQVRQSFLREVDSLNPDYAAARAAWAGPSKAQDALAMGRQIFSKDAEISADVVARMSPSEREMFAAGAARAIADKVDNSADGRNVVASFFNKPAFRDKLRAAFPDDASFNQFSDLMQREMNMATRANQYGPRTGSQTVRTGADQADMEIDPPVGVLANLLADNYKTAAGQAASYVFRPGQNMNSSTADALAPMLFAGSPQEQSQVLSRLLSRQQQNTLGTSQTRALARALLAGGGASIGGQFDQRQ